MLNGLLVQKVKWVFVEISIEWRFSAFPGQKLLASMLELTVVKPLLLGKIFSFFFSYSIINHALSNLHKEYSFSNVVKACLSNRLKFGFAESCYSC